MNYCKTKVLYFHMLFRNDICLTAGQAGQAGQRGPTGAAAAPPPTAPVGNSPQDLLDLFGGQTEDPQASSANSISGQLFRTFRQNVAQ